MLVCARLDENLVVGSAASAFVALTHFSISSKEPAVRDGAKAVNGFKCKATAFAT